MHLSISAFFDFISNSSAESDVNSTIHIRTWKWRKKNVNNFWSYRFFFIFLFIFSKTVVHFAFSNMTLEYAIFLRSDSFITPRRINDINLKRNPVLIRRCSEHSVLIAQ